MPLRFLRCLRRGGGHLGRRRLRVGFGGGRGEDRLGLSGGLSDSGSASVSRRFLGSVLFGSGGFFVGARTMTMLRPSSLG